MAEYLPLNELAIDRSRLEAMQRSAGIRGVDVTEFWHGVIKHPITGQPALVVQGESDKEYLSVSELSALLSQTAADAADWFHGFDDGI